VAAVFLPFVKKNSSELDLLSKIKGKYPDLPLSSVLGLIIAFNRSGLEKLNKDIVRYVESAPSVPKAVINYLRETLTKDLNFDFDLKSVVGYSHLIYVYDDLLKKHDLDDLEYFLFVI